jgi:DNA-binding CsgD family transcriptional regulator
MEEENKPQKFHYTYEITNVNNGMKYIGARSCTCLPCFDPYMGSSKTLKKAIKEDEHAHFIKIVLQEFHTRKEAYAHEIELHAKFDVGKNSEFYNKAKQLSEGFAFEASGPNHPMYHKPRRPETIQKISETHKGAGNPRYRKIITEKEQKNLKKSRKKGKDSPFYGKALSPSTRKKLSDLALNRFYYIYVTPMGEFDTATEAGKILNCYSKTIKYRCVKEFDGYFLKPRENKFKKKKEEFKILFEKGLMLKEIAKILSVSIESVSAWKKKLKEKKETP